MKSTTEDSHDSLIIKELEKILRTSSLLDFTLPHLSPLKMASLMRKLGKDRRTIREFS